jgi:hypothetical protein
MATHKVASLIPPGDQRGGGIEHIGCPVRDERVRPLVGHERDPLPFEDRPERLD